MQKTRIYILPGKPPGFLSRILALVVSVLVLVASFFFGLFVFLAVLGFGVIFFVAWKIRQWMYRREKPVGKPDKRSEGTTIEGEIVYRDKEDR